MSSLETRIEKAFIFEPFRRASRYKCAHGGRGSGKSHEFAGNLVLFHAQNPGARSVCVREVQKSLKESAKRLLEDKIDAFGLRGFRSTNEDIRTPGGGVIMFTGMKDHNAESVKSMEDVSRCWVEEAQTLSARSLELLRPTIRADNSEMWFSWNPRLPTDPVDQMFRGPNCPNDAIVIEANWNHNPWFPSVLEEERKECLANEPEKYPHIWDGAYQSVHEGAYYQDALHRCEREGRIGVIARDPLLPVYGYWDIGGTSRKSDATAIWVVQYVGDQIRVLDFYEARGQEFSEHVHWLQSSGWGDAIQILPHDGGKHETIVRMTPQSFLRTAGFNCITLPNAGAGAARKRVDAVRAIFPRIWFHDETTKPGREALAWYHPRIDEHRGIDLGPEHDWASHASDAFGSMATDVDARQPTTQRRERKFVRGIV